MTRLHRYPMLVATALLLSGCMSSGPGRLPSVDFPDVESWERVPLLAAAGHVDSWKRPERLLLLPPRLDVADAHASARGKEALQVLAGQMTEWGLDVALEEASDGGATNAVRARVAVGPAEIRMGDGSRPTATSVLHLEVTGAGTSPQRFSREAESRWIGAVTAESVRSVSIAAARRGASLLAVDLFSAVTPRGVVRERRLRSGQSLVRVSIGRVGHLQAGDNVELLRVDPATGKESSLGMARITYQRFADHMWIRVDDHRLAESLREGDLVRTWPVISPRYFGLL